MQSVYQRVFGMRHPYQLILDGAFLDECLSSKVLFKDALPSVLGGPVRLFTTQCVMHEMDANGSEAVFNARRLELRRCPHTGKGMSGSDCIRDIVGCDNQHRYGVCAQDINLRESLREVPGVPLVLLNRGILVLEDPSEATLRRSGEIHSARLKPREKELKIIEKIAPAPPAAELPIKKKKKKRGSPNPLSCKKPKSTQRPRRRGQKK
jgi:U3 small nucleolar RNA-associated protein 23